MESGSSNWESRHLGGSRWGKPIKSLLPWGLSLGFKRHKYYNLPVDRLRRIEDFLQNRVAEILEYGDKADDFLKISGENDSVNHVSNESCALQIKENLKADPFITYAELADLLQISPSSIARKIKALQESGEIRRVGADKNGYWDILDR